MEYGCIYESSNIDCPCRILKNGIVFCDFINFLGNMSLRGETDKIDHFLKYICPDLRDQWLYEVDLRHQAQAQEKKFLNNVKEGDIVFCISEIEEVIFLEKPNRRFGKCKYKTLDGEIKEEWGFCFRNISKGDKYIEYKVKEDNKLKDYKDLAKYYGFRVEVIKLKKGHLLKIYGDAQEELSNFLNLHLKTMI